MTVTVYDLSVRSFIQCLGAVEAFLGKGAEHLGDKADAILDMRLIDDMFPFTFQMNSIVHHSLGAIQGCKAGVFTPPPPTPELTYAGWQAKIADTGAALKALTADEVNALEGKELVFKLGERGMPFIAEDFLMSFSLPNLYFHATTAYDMLRMKGTPIGKRHFLGAMRMKT